MKVLILTLHYLDSNGGGSYASRAYANAFSEIADHCLLVYPDHGKSINNYVNKKCILKAVSDNRSIFKKVADIYLGKIHRFTHIAKSIIEEFNPDIVVFDNSRCSSGLLEDVKNMGKKVITIHHNYEIEYYNGTKPFILWRIPFMHFIEKAERTAVILSDLNLTLTIQDKYLLNQHYAINKRNIIIECLGCFEPKSFIQKKISLVEKNINLDSLNFVITGSLEAYQTEASIIPFLENIYPFLLQKLPNSTLTIAGRNPSCKIQKACSKYSSITLISNPIDMQKIISNMDIYICPTNIGGGLKLRVMDGLKAGLPVIVNSVSARGYDCFRDAGFLFIYNDKETFMQSLENLLKALCEKKIKREDIIKIYKTTFSFEEGVKRLNYLLNKNRMI